MPICFVCSFFHVVEFLHVMTHSADPDSRPTMVEVVKRLGEVYQGLSEIGPSCPPKSRESQRFEVLMEELQALRRVVNRGFLHA